MVGRYVKMVEDVQGMGGTVCLFSTLHQSGTQLEQLSGIAAVLRFPCELPEDDSESESSEEEADDYYARFHGVKPSTEGAQGEGYNPAFDP